jgi:hypothetical protein
VAAPADENADENKVRKKVLNAAMARWLKIKNSDSKSMRGRDFSEVVHSTYTPRSW